MKSMAWLSLVQFLTVQALPQPYSSDLQPRDNLIPRENDNRTIVTGEPPTDRTIFTVLSLFWMMMLSLLLGSRFSRLRRNATMKRNITSILVLAMYFLVMSFIFCSAVMLTGQGLYNYDLCFAATWVCLILYTFAKLVIYMFLVERVHVVRAPFVRRSHDWIYLSCLVLMTASFGAVAINAYLSPIIELKQSDGRCHMGIPGKASIPFMTVDIAVDIVLTGVFFYLLRPVIKVHGLPTISGVFRLSKSRHRPMTEKEKSNTAVQRNIRVLLWKSLVGSMLIMIPTVANMVQFYITQGRELALICLTLCVVDVSWDAVVIHWLTFGSAEAERNLTRSTQASQRAPLTKQASHVSKDREVEAQLATRSLLEEPPSAHTPRGYSIEFPRKDTSTDAITPVKPV